MKLGLVPENWKTAHVTPIFKKEQRQKASNYRPVNLTNAVFKIMESISRDVMVCYVESNSLITDIQHDFRSGQS